MKSLVLDANAIISLFDGDRGVAETMSQAERILIPAIVLGEVSVGIESGTARGSRAAQALESLLDRPNVQILNITQETSSFFVTVVRYLKKIRKPIPQDDLWIAAGVLETGSVLLTHDTHFDNLPMLRICR